MYYENYDDYMRNNSGFPNMSPNPYFNYTYQNQMNYMNQTSGTTAGQLYPELYTEINRKIENSCITQDARLTEENVNKITDQIFEEYKDKTVDQNSKSNERSRSNNLIRDFIKILVIKSLLSRQRNNNNYRFPMTPPMPNNYYQF